MGKTGPLFQFDVHDDVRLRHDATVEKVSSFEFYFYFCNSLEGQIFHIPPINIFDGESGGIVSKKESCLKK